MSVTDDSFFTENIVNINKRIYIILFWTLIVPVSFVALTQVGVWYVPTPYAAMIFIYSLAMAFICMVLNKTGNKNLQSVTMYLGLIGISGFVFLLGMKGVIVLTISWAFAPFISCLYYNRRLTRITTIINFVLTISVLYIKVHIIRIKLLFIN